MHVCFLNPPIEYYSPVSGGALATIIMQHARQFIDRGHHVTVLTPVNDDEIYPFGKVVPVRKFERHELTLAQRAVSKLRNRFEKWDWSYYEYYLGSFTRALKRLSPPPDVVITFNDLVSPKYIKSVVPAAKVVVNLQNEQGTRQQDISDTTASVHAFVACSKYIRDWTQKKYDIPAAKLAVINNGVDLEAFYPPADFPDKSDDRLRVLCIGRIDPNKGADIAADAVAVLQKEGLPICLTIAGGLWFYGHGNEMSDPYFRVLKEKMEAVSANYTGYVTRPHVPALVRSHDVVCVLSRTHDPNPLVCLEGMASGCAVIGADRGGIPDAFDQAGILVNPDDLNAVISALRALATDQGLLRAQKQQSVQRASRASWSVTVDALERLLA